MRYCVDASFVLARAGLSSDPAVMRLWRSFRASDELIAPAVMWAECTSVLARATYRGPLSVQLVRQLVEAMARLPITPVHAPDHYSRAFEIVGSLGRAGISGALYVAVAEIEGAELLTIDRAMHTAATRLSVPVKLVS